MEENNITVKDIVIKWLKDNGYDGLSNDGCSCRLENFMPCGKYCSFCQPDVFKDKLYDAPILKEIVNEKTIPGS